MNAGIRARDEVERGFCSCQFLEGGFKKEYAIESMKAVSTIGAGDNFNAGFIYGLMGQNITRNDIEHGLSEAQWDALTAYGKAFSAECCKDIYNYVSKDFGAKLKANS